MSSIRASKQQKTSKRAQKSPSPNEGEGVIQRKLRSSRLRSSLKEAESVTSTVSTDVVPNHYIEIDDDGVDKPVDGDDDASSIGSGPSLSYIHSIVKLSSPQALCSACRKLHQKAKRLKAPIKDKLLDNGEHCLLKITKHDYNRIQENWNIKCNRLTNWMNIIMECIMFGVDLSP